jgi:hypothetical protein
MGFWGYFRNDDTGQELQVGHWQMQLMSWKMGARKSGKLYATMDCLKMDDGEMSLLYQRVDARMVNIDAAVASAGP